MGSRACEQKFETEGVDERTVRQWNDDYHVKRELKPKQKYLSAPGAGNKLYLPPGAGPADLQNVDLPVVLVEGEKKTLAIKRMCGEGYLSCLPIGVPGVSH